MAFERHFGPGRGEFEQYISKKSNAWGVARGLPGGDVEASITTRRTNQLNQTKSQLINFPPNKSKYTLSYKFYFFSLV